MTGRSINFLYCWKSALLACIGLLFHFDGDNNKVCCLSGNNWGRRGGRGSSPDNNPLGKGILMSMVSNLEWDHELYGDEEEKEEMVEIDFHRIPRKLSRYSSRRRQRRKHTPLRLVGRTSMWPPWPLNLLQKRNEDDNTSSGASSSDNDHTTGGDKDDDSTPTAKNMYPSLGSLIFVYFKQRSRIGIRQVQEIFSQIWFNLPPATPPLILLASIPSKVIQQDPMTGEEITRRIFPIFGNSFTRSMIIYGLGLAILSWSQQELKRKRKLTPLNLAISYESVSRVFLPPFLPEPVEEPEIDALNEVTASVLKLESNAVQDNKNEEDSNEEEDDDNNSLLSRVSPSIRKHINGLYETATSVKPKKNMQYFINEWKRSRETRKREAAKIRRQYIFDELIALQALKRKAAAKKKKNLMSSNIDGGSDIDDPKPGFALVTGASSGIGRAIAVELARWEIPLVLVARDINKLTSLAYDLEACYGVKCCVLGADLSQIDAAERIHETTKRAGITVDILVNNGKFLATNLLPISFQNVMTFH